VRAWLLVLCLSLAVAAEERVTRLQGRFQPQGLTIAVKGAFYSGEVRLAPEMDLRDCRQLRVRMQLKNGSAREVRLSVYLTLADSSGSLLGSCGYDTSYQEAGKLFEHEQDVAVPLARQENAAYYQLVLYEEGR